MFLKVEGHRYYNMIIWEGLKTMGFLDQLKDTITDAGAKAQTKAKEVADTVSLKNQIHTEEKKQMELFVRLGKAYFEAHKDDENDAMVAKNIKSLAMWL